MKKRIGRLLELVAPRTWATIQSIRARRRMARLQCEWGLAAIAKNFVALHGERVSGGPFAGMILPLDHSFAGYVAMLVGASEQETAPALRSILTSDYRVIANVGYAEGYLAIGLAMQIPSAVVHAFDIDPWARRYCRRLAALNHVEDRVHIHGWCDFAGLASSLKQRSLVICDCEGYESELLNPTSCPELRHSDILVELHDFARPGGVTGPIVERFSASHDIVLFEIQPRDPADYPQLLVLPEAARHAAIAENRSSDSRWAWMQVRERI